ncbi:hypothetical protein ADK52_29195 [Streptomyces sp. WM6372]|uniref:hypothetical protein n=1 Tax=Streptomyces sp. WM6372 TaxID=1415555 RepID=UPI0006AD948B|nr:hypothetical protein [Streptomyces sp. WM6372]KOU19124.1 hypothetical protein ADK52_29195 [Streptomyces sp. WM6372]
MRKMRWAAAAAGAVLLIAGCGSESDSPQGRNGDAPSAGGSATAKAGSGGGLDVEAVRKEIDAAATTAGFTARQPADDAPPGLKSCTVRWQADGAKSTDSRKSYDATVATLLKGGWKERGRTDEKQSVTMAMDKGGWNIMAWHYPQGRVDGTDWISFIANDTGPACKKPFQEDLADKTTNKQ